MLLTRERSLEWNQCLVVGLAEAEPLVADMVGHLFNHHIDHRYHKQSKDKPAQVGDPDWGEYWDWRLQSIADDSGFTAKKYDEVEHNCMAFVLAFLASLKQVSLRVRQCSFEQI